MAGTPVFLASRQARALSGSAVWRVPAKSAGRGRNRTCMGRCNQSATPKRAVTPMRGSPTEDYDVPFRPYVI